MNSIFPNVGSTTPIPFLGLAPFLRLSLAGMDLRPLAQEMLAQTEKRPDDANLWMNLSLAMQCLGQRDFGLAIQAQALSMQRIYRLAAMTPSLRLLLLMAPGDLAENTPLECLLENSDIDLIFYYLTPDAPLNPPIPEHDAVLVAMGDSDANRPLLARLESLLAAWAKPVINSPHCIPSTERGRASQLLQGIPGLLMPLTWRLPRPLLQAIADGGTRLAVHVNACDFPVILRPLGSQAGRDLERIDDAQGMAAYLARVDAAEFFISRFVDYRSADGRFRKFRLALIDGRPFACHMAVSSHWMVHYVNAGMYEDADKRAEEAHFMANFDDFAHRHRVALAAICTRTGLDYFCIDCAETTDGQLLVFEVDHVMVVHAMDLEELFPYKQTPMLKVHQAFQAFLRHRTSLANTGIRQGRD